MIDKLALTIDEIKAGALFQALGGHKLICKYNQHYGRVEAVQDKEGKHLYSLSSEPTKPGANPYKLEFNPSKLDFRYDRLLAALDLSIDIDKAKIQRIDLAADHEISVSKAFESIRVKYKRNVKTFGDYRSQGLTGFYAGSKDEVFAVYDKAFEQRSKSFKPTSFKKVKGLHPFVLTRFELRQKYKMSPIRSLKELPFLVSYNPFENLQSLELRDELKDVYEPFKRRTALIGMQNVYKELNKQNNFKRDQSKHFKESDLPDVLRAIYRENLGHYFEVGTGEVH